MDFKKLIVPILMVAVVAGYFIGMKSLHGYYGSEDFKRAITSGIALAFKAGGGSARAEIEKIVARKSGFVGSNLHLFPYYGDDKALTVGSFDVQPSVFALLIQSNFDTAVVATVGAAGKFSADVNAQSNVSGLLEGTDIVINSADIKFSDIEVPGFSALVFPTSESSKAKIAGGKMSGSVTYNPATGAAVNLDFQDVVWKFTGKRKRRLKVTSIKAELSANAERIEILTPVKLTLPRGQSEISGKVELGKKKPQWNVRIKSSGMIAAGVMSQLFKCQKIVTKLVFEVKGSFGLPICG